MNLTEFIGFLFSFGLFIFMMFRQALAARQRKKYPEIAAAETSREDEALRQLLRELEVDEEELPEEIRLESKPKVVPPKVPQKVSRPLPQRTVQPAAAPVAYEVVKNEQPLHSEILLEELSQRKNMLVYYEIFGPPKALRRD